ncbi:MAG: 50S ribosomal protein P1 [Candidatus Micrarchaeota archaeon]|nr:50S ribosomal protein P1 [Candidatus Micrarchaeota archaeon]
MEYVYAALLLDAAGKEINEKNIEEVVKAAGFTPDEAQAKAITASLKGVNIKDVIKNAQTMQVQAAAAPAAGAAAPSAHGEKKEHKDEKAEAKKEEEAAGGLASLFGG